MKKLKLVVNNEIKKNNTNNYFVKKELKLILNLYAQMISQGYCKDYGLSIGPIGVSFDIYKRSSERPIIRIFKNLKFKHNNEKYLVLDKSGITIKKHENLSLLLNQLNWFKLKIVS
tara:strand:- start:421 stop:768 length:348 start_codon:yes stop_codon:yes gene_type:complete